MKYDVVVIGGGPAGMMAAGRAGELNKRVLLLEKNVKLGAKLLLTGKGRCNVTNDMENDRELVAKYGKNGKFLFSSLSVFGPQEVIDFLEKRGVKMKTERGKRVFPKSDKALDVLSALTDYMHEGKVEHRKGAQVKRMIKRGDVIEKVVLVSGEEIEAEGFIIATGGKSYPEVGCTGDGYSLLQEMGHSIVEPKPSLVSISVKEKDIVRELEGLSLRNVEISIFKDNKKLCFAFGEAIFTSEGLSGPIILDLSRKIGRENIEGMEIRIDFKPALDFPKLDLRVQRDFDGNINKFFRNSLNELLPQKLIPVIIKMSEIEAEKKVNIVSKEERKKLIHLIKDMTFNIEKLGGFERAIVTSGGVSLKEVDSKNMKSKMMSNLFVAGEILDLDGPTGGFNLQVCWSTGYAAGQGIAGYLK